MEYRDYGPKLPPFSSFVSACNLPDGFQLPSIEPYDGSTDPDEHLNNFYVHMTLYGTLGGAYDAIFCRAFPCTLTGPALRWFFTLPPNSIYFFSDLTKLFLSNFLSTETCPKLPTTLMCLKQRTDESLENYLDRFDQEARKVDGLSHRIYMHLIEAGLKPGSFKQSLINESPLQDLKHLRRRAARFADNENKPALQPSPDFFKELVSWLKAELRW